MRTELASQSSQQPMAPSLLVTMKVRNQARRTALHPLEQNKDHHWISRCRSGMSTRLHYVNSQGEAVAARYSRACPRSRSSFALANMRLCCSSA